MLQAETYLKQEIENALAKAYSLEQPAQVVIEKPRQEGFGDFASTVALGLAKVLKTAPRAIAETVVAHLEDPEGIFEQISVDGPGFINVSLSAKYWHQVAEEILTAGNRYGQSDWGRGEKVQVEFVSANPTGPLNVVSARAAAVGDVLVSLFRHVGFDAAREYYVNDAGRQIRLLGRSVSARYMALFGKKEPLPEDGYQGEYIRELAEAIKSEIGDRLVTADAEHRAAELAELALEKMLASQKAALENYRVKYDLWFRESTLRNSNAHVNVLARLRENGYVYERDGAQWFRSMQFGDEKDRVLVTREGEPTYFLVDIAYHENKYLRGFKRLYDLWGPDHHGYIPRMSAALQALGHPKDSFMVRIIQQVNMLRGGQLVKMSKRAGNIIMMDEVVNEVGVDAARFFFLMRKLDSPLDFDIDLAKKQSDENPVYYVQYAHARLSNILAFAREKGIMYDPAADFSPLQEEAELAVIKKLAEYPGVISKAAQFLEPHRVTTYLMELAATFHSFYQKHRVVSEDRAISLARLKLVQATRLVLRNALELLKIAAPEKM